MPPLALLGRPNGANGASGPPFWDSWHLPGRQDILFQEKTMPKMKTKSGAKKRFKITKSGKVLAGQAGKRHGMIKRSNDQIRRLRGTTVVEECDARVIKKKFMPYGRKKK